MLCAALTWLMLGAAGAEAPSLRSDVAPQVEQEIKALELHLADLLTRREFDSYGSFVAEDYTRIDERGQVQTRREVFEQFRSSRGGGTLEPTELVVKAYGDTAILTGLLRVKSGDGSDPERISRFRKVFIRRAGRWYLVSLQGVPYRGQ